MIGFFPGQCDGADVVGVPAHFIVTGHFAEYGGGFFISEQHQRLTYALGSDGLILFSLFLISLLLFL